MKGNLSPKFRLSLNKAFEIVALFGPVLYARNPVRACRPHRRPEYSPEMVAEAVGVPAARYMELQRLAGEADQALEAYGTVPPELLQAVQEFQQVNAAVEQLLTVDSGERQSLRAACQVMEQYLSYTPTEQPGGGLEQAGEDGITELLIKGRGLLFPRPYTMPGGQVLTGCFYESADSLITDPDATTVTFGDTKWMVLEHWNPTWEVERLFKLPAGSLKGRGRLESSEAQANRRTTRHKNLERQHGGTFDLMQWFECWSLAGVGTRLHGVSKVMEEAFDNVVGDAAYICVSEGVPYPLNAPAERMRTATDDEVRKMFSWPVPFHLDKRWPCAMLEAYREPGNPYPVAPLRPGLGELTFLNIVISALCGRVYNNSRTVLAVQQGLKKYVNDMFTSSSDEIVLELKHNVDDINKAITELKRADVSFDVWKMVDAVFELFDKRVGLSDLYYGLNAGGAASRTAADIHVKQEKLSIRPDHMKKKVDGWLGEAARMEKLTAYWAGVEGRSIQPLLGTIGARLWDRLIVQADPETILREMDATTEAGTAARPNKERDLAAIEHMFPVLVQELSKHADATSDTSQLNELLSQLGDKIDAPDHFLKGIKMGPRVPPPPPPGTPDPAALEMEADQAEHEQEMRQDQEEHRQKIGHKEEEHEQQMRLLKAKARVQRLESARNKSAKSAA